MDWYELTDDHGEDVSGWGSARYLTMLEQDELDPAADPRPRVQSRVLTVLLTAYSYQEPGEGAHGWLTKSGVPVTWGVVAVDPLLIPLGSRLAIDGFAETFVACDTGFGVRGAHVDVFFPDQESAVQFGVQYRDIMVASESD
jgi:3D (Asp-Asp-Asp) domain-containing protein